MIPELSRTKSSPNIYICVWNFSSCVALVCFTRTRTCARACMRAHARIRDQARVCACVSIWLWESSLICWFQKLFQRFSSYHLILHLSPHASLVILCLSCLFEAGLRPASFLITRVSLSVYLSGLSSCHLLFFLPLHASLVVLCLSCLT